MKVFPVVEVCDVQHVFLAVCPEGNDKKISLSLTKRPSKLVPDTKFQSSKTLSHPLDQILGLWPML